MTLLDVITKASANLESLATQSDYPIILNPDDVIFNLKSKLEEPNPTSLVNPVVGWQMSKTDSEVIELDNSFFKKLKRRLKDTKNFDKDEFIGVLNSFLEKISDKVGVSVASTDKDFTKVLIQKVGSLMGQGVMGLVLEACVSLEIWELIETLIVNRLIQHSHYSNLIMSLVTKRRSDLLCLCIKYASNLGYSELLCILKYFLCPTKDAYKTMVLVKKEWESQALLAIEKASDKGLTGKKSHTTKEAAILLMVAHDEFTAAELCLHYLVASSNIDEVVLTSSISKLNGKELASLLQYLEKWLRKYERFPQAGPCPDATSLLGLRACEWVPKLEDVVKFLGLVLDENYSTLVLHPEFHDRLQVIASSVASLPVVAKLCCSVAGVVEKLITEVKDA